MVQEALRETIISMHEGNLESQQLTSMLSIQQQRDRYMARQLLSAPVPSLLIAGGYHASKKHGRTVTHGRSCHRHPSSGVDACRKGMNITVDHADYVWFVAPDTTKGKPWMMNILHFSQSVKWSSWFICSLLLHGLIFLAFIWRFSEVQPAMSPAPAIMLQWAEIIEAPSSPLSLPVGIAQQESAVTEEKQQTEDRQQRPVTEDSDATIEITRKKKSSDGEKKKTRPPRKIKAQTSDSNPTAVSSNAAPQALVESSRIAAPFNSDSTKRDNSEASWESRVKGHLNRYKRYPGDARKRARTGTAVVTFTVNTEGTIVSSFLEISSGTFSLDREAIAVLERAQPLPKPPPEILEGGLFKVKMPITFKLKE